MAVEKYNAFWRKSLAIGILPFAALGVAGCDNSEPAEEDTVADEEVVEEDPAATGDTLTSEGEEDTLADEEVVEEDATGGATDGETMG